MDSYNTNNVYLNLKLRDKAIKINDDSLNIPIKNLYLFNLRTSFCYHKPNLSINRYFKLSISNLSLSQVV